MKNSGRKSRARTKSVTFKHSVTAKVTVKRAEFVYLSTLRYVDPSKLAKGTHQVEVGYLKAPCCKRLVTATVTHGLITAFEVEPCDDTKPVPPEFAKLMAVAVKKLRAGVKNRAPVSFADFAAGRIDVGALFPCGWIIVQPDAPRTQQGIVIFCCVRVLKFGPIQIPILNCGALPFPPPP